MTARQQLQTATTAATTTKKNPDTQSRTQATPSDDTTNYRLFVDTEYCGELLSFYCYCDDLLFHHDFSKRNEISAAPK